MHGTLTFPDDRITDAELAAAAQELADWINELPEHVFHVGHEDVREGAYRLLTRARLVRKAVQR